MTKMEPRRLTPKEMAAWASSHWGAKFNKGDKRALFNVIFFCLEGNLPVPKWAVEAFKDAYLRSLAGKLKSWNEVFGKPFPGKSAKSAAWAHRSPLVHYLVCTLMVEHSATIPDVFTVVGEHQGLSSSTVRDMHYYECRLARKHGRDPLRPDPTIQELLQRKRGGS